MTSDQLALDGIDPAPRTTTLNLYHVDMLRVYGGTANAYCRTCQHLERHMRGAVWFKCAMAHPTSSTATDWRAHWAACGLYQSAHDLA